MPGGDHRRIRAKRDRSFTMAMITEVRDLDPGQPEWSEALETLLNLGDHRSIGPLLEFVLDRHRPVAARTEVGRTLAALDPTTTSAQRVAWWESGDEVMQAFAMRLMDRSEAEIVLATATDPEHPLQALAVAALESRFEEAEYQASKVAALTSPRPDVREAAIYAVSWDEPLTAEPELRHLLSDEDPAVAKAAAYAIQYFPSLATLEHLRAQPRHEAPNVERQRAESIDFLEGSIEAELALCDARQREALQRWVDAIDFQPDETESRSEPEPQVPGDRLDPLADPAGFDDALDTTSGSFFDKAGRLRSVDWEAVAVAGDSRFDIADRLVLHPDPEVRVIASGVLARWNDGGRLLELLEDEHTTVRQCAMYSLGRIEPDRRYAAVARDRLASVAGTAATETLTTFARHAEPAERDALLFDFAVGSDKFNLRAAAVQLLADAGAERLLQRLIPLLDLPPLVTWAYHVALLDTDAARTARPSRVAELIEVDNIHIAAAAARSLRPTE